MLDYEFLISFRLVLGSFAEAEHLSNQEPTKLHVKFSIDFKITLI